MGRLGEWCDHRLIGKAGDRLGEVLLWIEAGGREALAEFFPSEFSREADGFAGGGERGVAGGGRRRVGGGAEELAGAIGYWWGVEVDALLVVVPVPLAVVALDQFIDRFGGDLAGGEALA